GVFDADTYRKALRDVHPVQLALDLRHAGDDRLVLGVDRPPDPLHRAAKVVLRVGQYVHLRLHPGRNVLELGLAIVRQDIPNPGVHQREHRRGAGRHELADGGVQVDDERVEWSAYIT